MVWLFYVRRTRKAIRSTCRRRYRRRGNQRTTGFIDSPHKLPEIGWKANRLYYTFLAVLTAPRLSNLWFFITARPLFWRAFLCLLFVQKFPMDFVISCICDDFCREFTWKLNFLPAVSGLFFLAKVQTCRKIKHVIIKFTWVMWKTSVTRVVESEARNWLNNGGERGIWTPGRVAPTTVFETNSIYN